MTITETIARGIAVAKGIEICADASYEHSSIGALAKAAITALTEAGYAIVPIEPTEAMLEAANLADRGMMPWAAQYRAMLAADALIDSENGE